ncbi:MAG: pdhC2 [Brevibacillus sp.]|nr:pdhC2 [Brevibacillus sp.]
MVEFKLPDVGEGMHEGEIVKILVSPGEAVHQDQPVIEVQTDKVNAELSAPVTGVIKEIRIAEGDTVEVGSTLLVIDTGTDTSESKEAVAQEGKTAEKIETASIAQPVFPLTPRALATPYVRQLARELKIDIEKVSGTGAAGRVTEEDVRNYAAGTASKAAKRTIAPAIIKETIPAASEKAPALSGSSATADAQIERIAIKGIRKKIAEHMTKSVAIIPHVTSVDEMEMDQLRGLREQMMPLANKRNIKLTFLPFFIKALVIALKEFPVMNASIDDVTNEILLKRFYHIGIATDTPDGLIVPVIKDADRKSIFQLADEITTLAQQARDSKLTMEQITGGTFTISNVGPIGGLQATPIINHPEVAIIALHKMEKRWVVREDEGVIRWMMNFSLSFDHRLIDGVTAVRFTNRIKELLENPTLLFAEMV